MTIYLESAVSWWNLLEPYEAEDVLTWWQEQGDDVPFGALDKQVAVGLAAPGDVTEATPSVRRLLAFFVDACWSDAATGWAHLSVEERGQMILALSDDLEFPDLVRLVDRLHEVGMQDLERPEGPVALPLIARQFTAFMRHFGGVKPGRPARA